MKEKCDSHTCGGEKCCSKKNFDINESDCKECFDDAIEAIEESYEKLGDD